MLLRFRKPVASENTKRTHFCGQPIHSKSFVPLENEPIQSFFGVFPSKHRPRPPILKRYPPHYLAAWRHFFIEISHG